jgi:hypothetical protein
MGRPGQNSEALELTGNTVLVLGDHSRSKSLHRNDKPGSRHGYAREVSSHERHRESGPGALNAVYCNPWPESARSVSSEDSEYFANAKIKGDDEVSLG